MDWDVVASNWKQFKGKIRVRWGKLTDDQLELIAGKRNELAIKIQEAYCLNKEEVEYRINLFVNQNKDYKKLFDK
jgi:uncharacterized protein YjbJ (UPF0337 family)